VGDHIFSWGNVTEGGNEGGRERGRGRLTQEARAACLGGWESGELPIDASDCHQCNQMGRKWMGCGRREKRVRCACLGQEVESRRGGRKFGEELCLPAEYFN